LFFLLERRVEKETGELPLRKNQGGCNALSSSWRAEGRTSREEVKNRGEALRKGVSYFMKKGKENHRGGGANLRLACENKLGVHHHSLKGKPLGSFSMSRSGGQKGFASPQGCPKKIRPERGATGSGQRGRNLNPFAGRPD